MRSTLAPSALASMQTRAASPRASPTDVSSAATFSSRQTVRSRPSAHSSTVTCPLPPETRRCTGPFPTPPDVPSGIYRQIWAPGAKFGFYPVRNGTCWYCTVKASDRRFEDQSGRKAAIRDRVKTYPPPTLSLLDAESEHPITRAVITTNDLSKPWVVGRVALLGDAAHALAPHLGQGAGQAIEDAFVLAECLRTNADTVAALGAYEHRRKAHVRGIAKQSHILGKALVLENPVAHMIWRNAVKLTWPPIGSKQYVKIHSHES